MQGISLLQRLLSPTKQFTAPLTYFYEVLAELLMGFLPTNAANTVIQGICQCQAVGLCKLHDHKSLTLHWRIVDSLLKLCWRSVDALLTLCWRSVDALLTLCWRSVDALLTLCWRSVDTLLTVCWHSVDGLLTLRWGSDLEHSSYLMTDNSD